MKKSSLSASLWDALPVLPMLLSDREQELRRRYTRVGDTITAPRLHAPFHLVVMFYGEGDDPQHLDFSPLSHTNASQMAGLVLARTPLEGEYAAKALLRWMQLTPATHRNVLREASQIGYIIIPDVVSLHEIFLMAQEHDKTITGMHYDLWYNPAEELVCSTFSQVSALFAHIWGQLFPGPLAQS